MSGIGGHQDSSAKVASASVSASVVSRSSSEERLLMQQQDFVLVLPQFTVEVCHRDGG